MWTDQCERVSEYTEARCIYKLQFNLMLISTRNKFYFEDFVYTEHYLHIHSQNSFFFYLIFLEPGLVVLNEEMNSVALTKESRPINIIY